LAVPSCGCRNFPAVVEGGTLAALIWHDRSAHPVEGCTWAGLHLYGSCNPVSLGCASFRPHLPVPDGTRPGTEATVALVGDQSAHGIVRRDLLDVHQELVEHPTTCSVDLYMQEPKGTSSAELERHFSDASAKAP